MALQSPGVQVSEVDLSLRATGTGVTTVLIPGFATKGPVAEPIQVSTLSEFEQIYGQPTNAAERYFYHSVKAVFSSPADVLTYRLPYGEGSGVGTTTNYSALVYPVKAYADGAITSLLTSTTASYFFGKPTHVKLTEDEYLSIKRGDGFTWANNSLGLSSFDSVPSLGNAGLIILNKSQSSVNSRFEGYYIGALDNTNLNPATEYDDIQKVYSVNSSDTYITDFIDLPQARLDFPLSATNVGPGGSVSQALEGAPTFDIYNHDYDDTVVLGVFKLRQSVFSPDTISLGYVLEEKYVASLDANRQINSENGGTPLSFFLENRTSDSAQIEVLVNPYISNKNSSSWLDINGVPKKKVRFLGTRLLTPLAGETNSEYLTRVGAPQVTVATLASQIGEVDSLFALGDYSNQDLNTKKIGNVPAKLSVLFDKTENYDVYPINVVIEAGLGTVYVNSLNPATSGYFDDTAVYSAIESLTAQNPVSLPQVATDYLAVANTFINFSENARKDNISILDPITNIFVENNVKTLDDPAKTFSGNVYWPLRNQFSGINTSYACTFANCVKVADSASNQQVWVPFSGFAAANFGKTDTNFQPWFAPAGFTRGVVGGIVDLGIYPKQTQRDKLYQIGLNPIAFFPAEGYVIFGQKTLQKKPSAFDRINVRRLFLNLETATRDTVKFFVFEPNTLFTRTQVLNTLTPIFENAKNTQGLYDYLIICDERNNTPAIIDANELVVDVYLKPVRTAEFILANFYATRTGTNFQEIVS